jgi:hypothetical protein
MAPGGNHEIAKDLLTPPRKHARRYKEMLRIAEQLPPGEKQPPSEKLAIQWYYMTYHRADRMEYVKSGKKLAAKTLESLTGYFQALFTQKKADGTLKRAEIDRLRNRAKKRLASNLREKREARRTSYARRGTMRRESFVSSQRRRRRWRLSRRSQSSPPLRRTRRLRTPIKTQRTRQLRQSAERRARRKRRAREAQRGQRPPCECAKKGVVAKG